ncbi:hypothetical protein CCL15_04560 [Pseudomonas syringae]|nr:hypothetical protein CCL15_04560 [Pseudomonas syringae]
MNNAIASKQQLNLAVGVSLNSQQVAALTHDIVWLEEHEVNGEKVLVPVLYMAQADNRLGPTGALIAGNDVSLIAGQNLDNVGTLRAANNLSAAAGNDLVNSGLIEAGNRLDLLAGNDLINKSGGIIAGRDVTLTALRGDVINERTVTSHQSAADDATWRKDFADSAARIEAANDMSLQAGRDVKNTGGVLQAGRDLSIAAGRDVAIDSAQTENGQTRGANSSNSSITQLGSTVSAGRDLTAQAGRDINVIASSIDAKRDIAMAATENLTLSSAADEQHSYGKSKKVTEQEDHVSQVSSNVTAGGSVALSAGADLSMIASRINAKDEAYLYAGNDVNVLAAQDTDYSYYSKTKKGSWGKKSTNMTESDSDVAIGSLIQSGQKATIVAVNDVNFEGSKANSDNGRLAVQAGHDVNLTAAQNSQYSATATSKSGGFGLSTTSKMKSDASTQTSLSASTLSGNTTLVRAGNDLVVSASNVISTEQTTLQARNNIVIDSGTESFNAQHSQSTKKSGLMSTGGIGVTLGTAKNAFTQDSENQTQKGSTVGSVLGDVNITAGKDLMVKASDVVAGNDVNLIGQNVSIVQAQNRSTSTQNQESKKSGLTLALSGAVGEAVNTTVQNAQAAKGEDDSRLAALQGVKAGLSGYQAYQAAQAIDSGAASGSFFGIALSLGTQSASSKQVQEQNVSQGSSITAGNNLNIVATGSGAGAGLDGDINVAGSKLQAGQDMLLSASRDINLLAAANTQKVDGSNKSGGGAIGISLGVGSGGGGLTFFANANSGTGNEKGNGTTWTETTLDAGNKLSLVSGRDTTLLGAQASAQQIVANVGRDLSLTSLQDIDKYDSHQLDVSGGASFSLGTMTGSASLSVSQDKIKSNFESVQEQTGLFAGKGGYQVTVGDHTQLNGAVIASTAAADRNMLSTETLGWKNLKNQAEFTAQHQSASGSTSGKDGSKFMGNMGSLTLVGANHSGSDSSTTYSAVSDGRLTIRDVSGQQQDISTLSRDVDHASNALSPIFDKEKEQNRLRQAQLIGDIGSQAMDIVRTQGAIDAANAQKDPVAIAAAREKLVAEGNTDPSAKQIAEQISVTVMQKYGTGSDYQRAAQAVTAALQGLAGGNIAQALTGAAAPYLAEQIKQMTVGNKDANLMAHAVLGAVVAQAQGNSALAGAAGASVGEYIANQLYPGKKTSELSEEQRQTISALSTLAGGLAGGLVGGDASNTVAGASVAKNAVENNFLSVPEAERKKVLERKVTSGTITAQEVAELASLNKVDKERDAEIKAVCTAGNLGGSACGQLITVAKSAAERYGESASYSLLYKDIYPQDSQNLDAILQGLDSDSITRDTAITAITQASGLSRQEVENRYNFAMTAQALTAVLAGTYLPRGTSVTSKETVAKDPVSLAGQADNEAGILVDRNVIVGSAKGGSPEPVTYFRVEGGGSGTKTSQNRITANEDGTITINPGCAGQICVSVGNAEHAAYYLTNKRPDGSVVVFDVDAGLHKEIMDRVVPQRPVAGMTKDPDAPKRVDKDQPGYSLELPKVWESLLEKNSSNARVYTQDEFFKEFKQ